MRCGDALFGDAHEGLLDDVGGRGLDGQLVHDAVVDAAPFVAARFRAQLLAVTRPAITKDLRPLGARLPTRPLASAVGQSR
jgi:hypothetical protein